MSEARVDVVTFGCRLNIVESEVMRRQAREAGHDRLTVVNTCAVTAEASRQARQAIRRMRRERPLDRLVVTGCAAEIEADRFRAMPEVDAVLPNATKTDAGTWLPHGPMPADAGSGTASAHTRGFVAIQNGCDHRCTFCVIPFARGVSRSVPIGRVVADVRACVDNGVLDVVLTGVDITSYGADLEGRPTLGLLLQTLLRRIPDLPRLRLSSLDCIEADDALFEALGEQRVMPHLHLSLQSGSDLILKRMKRRHGRADAIAFCARVRALRPEIVFGADFIVGFPTETGAHFDDTLAVVEDCGLTHIHVFPYSARPETPAARMPPVGGAVIRERAGRLRARAADRFAVHLERQVGRRLSILTERGGKGRAEDFTLVRLDDADHPAGQLVGMVISGHDARELTGSVLP